MDRSFWIISAGRLIQIIISLVAVRIFTTLLSTAEVGNIYLINSIFGFFGLALIGPVGNYINRRLNKWVDDKRIIDYFFIYNLYLIFLSLLSTGIVYSLHKYFKVGGSIDIRGLIVIIMLMVYFLAWNQTIIPSLNLLNYRTSFVVFTVLTLSLGLTASIFLVKSFSASAVFWLSGQVFAQALVTIFAYMYFKRISRSSFEIASLKGAIKIENLKGIFYFSVPLAVTSFFVWGQNQSYRMIIENRIGLEYLGLIGLGIGVSSSIAVAVEAVAQQMYLPGFYREINTLDENRRAAGFNRIAQLSLPFYLSLTLLVSCLAPFLVNILAHRKFGEAYLFVVYGSWIELFRMTTNVLGLVAHSEMQTRYLLKAYFVGGVLAAGGVYFAAQSRHYQQAIPAVLVASGFAMTLIMYVEMKKLMKVKLGIRNIIRSFVVSLPFFLALLFYNQPRSLITSILIAFVFGVYFLIVQYRISKPLLGSTG